MMSTARGSSSSSASGSTKQQRNVKGFVKRCRSFKEDIISRLARNRSSSGAEDLAHGGRLQSRSGIASPSSWSSKSPTPGDDVEPVTLISHRLKEVNLTLHFVESLIQKNCVELLGGSSNVMLDLMGCLFNDIKKMPSSDSAQFQSIISQLKTVLSDFLTAVDALLLKEGYDDAQRQLYFEKVHESIATSRDALSGLRNLIDTNACSSTLNLSTGSPFPPLKSGVLSPELLKSNNSTSLPPSSASSSSSPAHLPQTSSSPSKLSSETSNNVTPTPSPYVNCVVTSTPGSSNAVELEEKKPPLPPKTKHFSRRSFDSEWPDSLTPTSTSAGPSSPRRMVNRDRGQNCDSQQQQPQISLVVAPVVSLDQWLEQSSCSSKKDSTAVCTTSAASATASSSSVRVSIKNTSSGCDATASSLVVSSTKGAGNTSAVFHHHQFSSGLLTTANSTAVQAPYQQSNQSDNSDSSLWVSSSVYLGRPLTSSTGSENTPKISAPNHNHNRNRTYSDSYQLEYDDDPLHPHAHLHPHSLHHDSVNHIDRLVSDFERRSCKSGTTHNSLSLSLGSSLDNLLLVDAQSQQSGLSPNSNTSGTGCTGAMHSLSGSSGNHPSDATGRLTGNNPLDFEVDEDVFVNDVVDLRYPNQNQNNSRLSKQNPIVQDEDSENEAPPELPEKRRINKHFNTIDYGYGGGGCGFGRPATYHHEQQVGGSSAIGRCHSPYDNVDENDAILQCWPGGPGGTGVDGFKVQSQSAQHHSFMSQSESRVTLVGRDGGNDSEERPPLPPKKKHSLIAAYVEFMHNFDLHSQRHPPFCNHYGGMRNHHFQEGDENNFNHHPHHHHQQGFHRPYLSERSATMFNPSTGEIPGFALTSSSSSAAAAATRAHSAYVAGVSTATGVVNRAALYSASYHHFTTFSNSSIPSEDNSPTHQHFPLTSSSSTSHSLSEHTSGGENGNGNGNEAKPPLPPKKSRSLLKGLLGDLSKDSSLENDKSNGNSNGHTENGTPSRSKAATPTSPLVLQPQNQLQSQSPTTKSPLSPTSTSSVPPQNKSEVASTPASEKDVKSTTAQTPGEQSGNGSIGKTPQRSLDDESIDLFMIDPTPLLVLNKNPPKSSPPSSTSANSNSKANGKSNSSNANSNATSGNTEGQLEVKGAEPMVLLVYAASPDVVDAKFRETFLLTYRNFLRPPDVVTLLWKRFKHFENKTDRTSMIHARSTLDLFVDVVIGLTPMDLDEEMVSRVRKCIYHLVCSGEIQSALKARKGVIHKYQVRQKILKPTPAPATLAVTTEAQAITKWSATSIAQQMTLLDADLFRELEPAELLLWAREQVEDLCPALNNFTEHFNKVSYWTRTRVLMCNTSRERNRTMKKLIGVMRKLREYNNFNSLLAVLAALDSAPIRRLGFSRRLTEALKPHAALTDSSGSFRTYRQALADCHPPCIPYIGLVLQDLTFVHIGNPDFLVDGKVNWVKRLQQWVILEPIRRLHLCHYGFSRNDSLLAFLNNFDEYLNDDDLWQLSESIKPQTKNN